MPKRWDWYRVYEGNRLVTEETDYTLALGVYQIARDSRRNTDTTVQLQGVRQNGEQRVLIERKAPDQLRFERRLRAQVQAERAARLAEE